MAVSDGGMPGANFWVRLSRRSKAILMIDLALLAVIVIAGIMYLIHERSDTLTPDTANAETAEATTPPPQPFRTPYGFAWIVAACGGPMVIEDLPDPPLPRASDSGICLTSPGGLLMTVGVYDSEEELRADISAVGGAHRHAARSDDAGLKWLFLVEGHDAEPLAPLVKYGFEVH